MNSGQPQFMCRLPPNMPPSKYHLFD